jgi:hypothetical protein
MNKQRNRPARRPRTRCSRVVPFMAALALLLGCGVSDRKVTPGAEDGGGSGGGAGTAGGAGNAGSGGSGNTGGAGASCTPPCQGATPYCENDKCVECLADSAQCENDTPVLCVASKWSKQSPCGGNKPACSNGVCAAARGSGGIITMSSGVLTGSAGNVRLVDHGFERMPRTCGTVKTERVCVTGGITP